MFLFNATTRIVVLAGLVSLSITSHVIAQEELDGPGVFSGEKGEFSLSKIFAEKTTDDVKPAAKNYQAIGATVQNNHSETYKTVSSLSNSQAVLPKSDEFEMFKSWRAAKEQNTDDYQEFKLWLEYQDYKHKKATH
ncbi:hypothetical protein [Paraglaciecola polaris]|uniref:RxLR effector protein n=1 Tax=Paraglaciecola polaris LMG 21857 TaxID=1129793 RepID=K6YE56_9ALTE|nr:hypothetical protein [Paraglaciecola polaris]GAC31024.1 hypothetical protein GPLA_0103 [Paraglaciecola polaris LMG 21857]|tara:strand:+ start:676 stop:1083 length:408 start_codon:yes stop_codon:yes gene_type:complete